AVPRMPMVAFELKISSEYTEYSSVLKQYIRSHYNEDPSEYSNECTELDNLRQSATRISQDFVGCKTLKRYFCQLQNLQSRFPMGDGGDCAVHFTWDDIYTGRPVTVADVKFEQGCILYNIGSLHAILGAIDNRQTAEGRKMSCTHFQCAAWAFEHLRDHFASVMSVDMTHDLLTFKYNLMLAQAQECILEKSMIDNRKSTITTKVACQIVDYYRQALKYLESSNASNIVGSRKYKDWKRRLELKMKFHECIMYIYLSNQSEEQQKWGERVTYLKTASSKLEECDKLGKGDVEEIHESLRFTRDVVVGKYDAAKKDNDFVYHEKEPALDSLPEPKGAKLVNGIAFNASDPEVCGIDIFHKLVPLEAHESSSLYSEEKAKLLRRVGSEVEEKNQELGQFMSSLQVENLKSAGGEPERLPQTLLEKCALISVKPNAVKDLVTSMQALSGKSLDVECEIKEIEELIANEQKQEEEFQAMFGKRSILVIIPEAAKECSKFKEVHTVASQSNSELHKAMNTHTTNLKLLSGPLEELQAAIPTAQQSEEDVASVNEMLRLVSKVDEMKSQREMLMEQFRTQVHKDDITSSLVTREDKGNEEFFLEEIKKHDQLVGLIQQNLKAQSNILRALTEANANYATARRATGAADKNKQTFISNLILSYDVYEDLLQKSKKGIEFYEKLGKNVSRLLLRIKGVCKAQNEEREMIIERHKPKGPPPSRPTAPKPGEAPEAGTAPVAPVGLSNVAPTNIAPPNTSLATSIAPGSAPDSMEASMTLPPLDPSGGPALTLKDYLPFMKPKTFGNKKGGPPGGGAPGGGVANVPVVSGMYPNMGETQPTNQHGSPVLQHKVGTQQPNMGAQQPNMGVQQPNMGAQQPN
ncbi:unnamed protein product, partial [Owenia fusiformis]